MASGGPGTNTGHGHVWPRPDGDKARCGGLAICMECARDFARYGSGKPVVTKVVDAITRAAFEQDGLISTGFAAYAAQFFRGRVPPPDQLRELRFAFFAGASHVFSSIMATLDEGQEPTDADLARMDSIHREVEAFAAEYIQRASRPEGNL